jgi:hypothetical protein
MLLDQLVGPRGPGTRARLLGNDLGDMDAGIAVAKLAGCPTRSPS